MSGLVIIIDYGLGNVASVKNAVATLNYNVKISANREDIEKSSHIILPGVGAFGDGVKNLLERGLWGILEQEVMVRKKPFLGICLGMQLLAVASEEGGWHKGLGWIQGTVRKFNINNNELRLPHIGWNDVAPTDGSRLFRGLTHPTFYFVHSYHLVPESNNVVSGWSEYGEPFAAALECGNIFGTQFHPEKSQQAGIAVLRNFLTI